MDLRGFALHYNLKISRHQHLRERFGALPIRVSSHLSRVVCEHSHFGTRDSHLPVGTTVSDTSLDSHLSVVTIVSDTGMCTPLSEPSPATVLGVPKGS